MWFVSQILPTIVWKIEDFFFSTLKNSNPTRHFYSLKAVSKPFLRSCALFLAIFNPYYAVFCHISGFFGHTYQIRRYSTNIHGIYSRQLAHIMWFVTRERPVKVANCENGDQILLSGLYCSQTGANAVKLAFSIFRDFFRSCRQNYARHSSE